MPTASDKKLARPTPTCCACIVRRGRLLLIQRGTEPNKGLWSFPGGRIELGETLFEAVKREAGEETGIEVEPLELFQTHDWIVRDDAGQVCFHYLVNLVRARHLSGKARPGDDALQTKWATETEITRLAMDPFVRETALRILRGTWRVPSQQSVITRISGTRTDPRPKATGQRRAGPEGR
ncbi:MAG: NUDIX hydrolase [Proteobacteria bacterium]|nr:NUDIX hydrolase [Pseudomonadota bacterium]